jgi:hypothetical protein
MVRASKITDANKPIDRNTYNPLIDDYVSQTDITAQTIESALTLNGKITFKYIKTGTATGSNPITVAHGLSGTPQIVTLGAKALQPYALAWNADATNIKIYHNAAGSLTVTWYAEYTP